MSEANQTEKKRPNVMRLEAEIAKKITKRLAENYWRF